jgi:hypothetical protein
MRLISDETHPVRVAIRDKVVAFPKSMSMDQIHSATKKFYESADADVRLDQLLTKYSNAGDTYSKIISFRKQAKKIDPDERASVEKAIAQYSNALNRVRPVRKMNKVK